MSFMHKNVRLPAFRYRGTRWYFVTLCCAARRRVFGSPEWASRIVAHLRAEATAYRFAIHAYCAMPDHLHVLARGDEANSDLLAFVKNFNQKTDHEFRVGFHRDLWQKKFYDRILRQTDSVERVAGYIWLNPVRAGICEDPREYPHSGSFTMDWKKGFAPVEKWVPPWKGKAPA
ncbi:MAG TPA: transposase [Candidatus Acidoferrales bacterium]|jgi:putative transposase|nr:transposase [Candidatus Acidoferrales bacterium]